MRRLLGGLGLQLRKRAPLRGLLRDLVCVLGIYTFIEVVAETRNMPYLELIVLLGHCLLLFVVFFQLLEPVLSLVQVQG